jgi:hypothetical protein
MTQQEMEVKVIELEKRVNTHYETLGVINETIDVMLRSLEDVRDMIKALSASVFPQVSKKNRS